jgi:hypothetical protein
MLDGRIYRTGLIVAALALVVLGFSLRNQQAALSPTLSPAVFNGANVAAEMAKITKNEPNRQPGSYDDENLATAVRNTFKLYGLNPTEDTFAGRTVDGTRPLENVIGVQPGSESGSIVIVAPRDTAGAPAPAAASGAGTPLQASTSGTATLMELARDLAGETLHRTVVLASTTGSAGAAGAIRLASTLTGPIDAVLVLGDLASAHVKQPIVVPWSSRAVVAPPGLRNTVAAALNAETSFTAGSTGLGGQFIHLAFPFTLGIQAPFGAQGVPAVELSLSGEAGPSAGAPVVGTSQITGIGRAVLETISALDSGPTLAAPSAYVLLDGKVVPGWAISLFVLALLVPVVMTTIDGVARARRHGHIIWRSLTLVIAAAVPFVLGVLVVLAGRLLGLIGIAPPGPVAAGLVALHGDGITVLAAAGVVMLAAAAGVFALARRLPTRPEGARRREPERSSEGAVVGVLIIMCVVTFAIWLSNPYAALLLVPALHLWLWAVSPDLRVPVPARIALILVGLAPPALVVLYYAHGLGYGPIGVIWQAALLLAGHGVSLVAAIEWSVVLGCLVSAATLSVLGARGSRVVPAPVTVRGPVTYAGPGSLGGTKSAIRR